MKPKAFKEFTCSMYQSMVYMENKLFDLKDIYKKLKNGLISIDEENEFIKHLCLNVESIKLHSPGALNSLIQGGQLSCYQLGSIEFKVNLNNSEKNTSILFFPTRIKISGGFLFQINDDEDMETYVSNIFELLSTSLDMNVDVDDVDIKIPLINGNMKLGYEIPNFLNFCDNSLKSYENDIFNRMVMPFTNEKGRVCAVKVYPYENVKSSAHFDQWGSIQFFGFKSMTDIIMFANVLKAIIDDYTGD